MDASLRDLVPIPRVWERLKRVETRLYEATTSEDDFLTDIAQHLVRAGGKRYRPLLAQVAAELGRVEGDAPVEAGVAVELIHIGSLYHDDVIDEADSRRGATSVNANWTNTVAILAGDFLLARASEVAAPLGTEAVELLARTYARLCEGQILELQLCDDLDHGPDEYYRVIGGKTASLIRTSARLGAMAGGASPEAVEAASAWGYEAGLVFQLADDVLDLVADEQFLGKPTGSDIREGTFTLPVLHALRGPNGAAVRALLERDRPHDDDTVATVIDLVRSGGHIEAAIAETEAHLEAAASAIDGLPDGDVTKVFRSLADYLVDRTALARQNDG
jgi:heptaprenyl diphosphate synthase